MDKDSSVLFLGGQTAGLIGLLTLLARGYRPTVVSYSPGVNDIANANGLPRLFSVGALLPLHSGTLLPSLIVSVHGREIVPQSILDHTPGINLHPCLWKYRGKHPVSRAMAAGEKLFSVGAHWMTEKVDEGGLITEMFVEASGRTEAEVYEKLYPLYSLVLMEALKVAEARL